MPYANAKLTTHFCGSQNTHIYNMENRSTNHNLSSVLQSSKLTAKNEQKSTDLMMFAQETLSTTFAYPRKRSAHNQIMKCLIKSHKSAALLIYLRK